MPLLTSHQFLLSSIAPPVYPGADPLSLAGLTAWFDFTDRTHIFAATGSGVPVTTDGQAVAFVKSKATPAFALINATAGIQPAIKLGLAGGKDITRYDGIDDSLLAGTRTGDNYAGGFGTLASFFTNSQAISIAVVKITAADAIAALPYNSDMVWGDNAGYMGLIISDPGGANYNATIYNFDSAAKYVSVPFIKTNYVAITTRFQSGNMQIRINGAAWTGVASGNTGNTSGVIYTGRAYNTSKFINMDIAHLVFANAASTDAQLYAVEQNLMARIGISI